MNETERLAAIDEIRQIKAKYFRSVDTSDGDLARSILAEDCVLDYRGCCIDPVTGVDLVPAVNVCIEGRDGWISDAFKQMNIVTVHQGHSGEVTIESDTTASAIWPFTDRFFAPPGGDFTRLTGYGHYHETYLKTDDGWKLKTTRVTRIWVEAS